MNEIASVRLGPKTLRTLDEEVKSLVSAWRLTAISLCSLVRAQTTGFLLLSAVDRIRHELC